MKYLDFEKDLKEKFTGETHPVDIEALISNVHNTLEKERGVFYRWSKWISLPILIGAFGLFWYLDHRSVSDTIAHVEQPNIQNVKERKMLTNEEKREKTQIYEDIKGRDMGGISGNVHTLDKPSKHLPNKITATINRKSQKEKTKDNRQYQTFLFGKNPKSSPINIGTENNSDAGPKIPIVKYTPISIGQGVSHQDIYISIIPGLMEQVEYTPKPYAINKDVECPTFSKGSPWHFDLIPEVGVFAPIKKLEQNPSQEPSEIFVERKENEKSLEGLQAALYGRLRYKDFPFYLKTGISFSRTTERLTVDQTWIDTTYNIGIIDISQSQNGDTLTVITGPVPTYTEHHRTGKTHYALQYIDIPVYLGYSSPLGRGWRWGVEAGVDFNFALSSSGKLLTAKNNFSDLPSGHFKTASGLSVSGSLLVEKAFNRRSSIYAALRYRHFLDGVQSQNNTTLQKYQFAGIHVGYIFRLK